MRYFLYSLLFIFSFTSAFGQRFVLPKTLFLEAKVNHKVQLTTEDPNYTTTGGTIGLTLPITKHFGIEASTDVIQFTTFSGSQSVRKENIKTEIYSPSLFFILQPTSFNKATINPYLGLGIGKYVVDIPSFTYGNDINHPSVAAESQIYRLKAGFNLKIGARLLINSGAEIISFKDQPFFVGNKNLISGFGGLIVKIGKQ